eukprot:5194619-Pleurochrysis_carterae.AAC.3
MSRPILCDELCSPDDHMSIEIIISRVAMRVDDRNDSDGLPSRAVPCVVPLPQHRAAAWHSLAPPCAALRCVSHLRRNHTHCRPQENI